MSLNFFLFTNHIEDSIIPEWMRLMNQAGMKCEIYPGFSFETSSGFLPFKIEIINPTNADLKTKQFLSGFEFYSQFFNLEEEIAKQTPKETLFRKLVTGNKKKGEKFFKNKEIDQRLKNCNKVLVFNWGTTDTFELRMASLSAAILANLTDGVLCYPADDIWYDNESLVNKFYKDAVEYENSIDPKDWMTHPFTEWL